MKTSLTKRKISNFFTYFGVLFLIMSVLVFAGWYYILNAIDEVKDYEKVNIFVETYGLKVDLESKVDDYLKENDETKLFYSSSVYNFSPDNERIADYYVSFGVYSDILILIEDDLIDMQDTIQDNFLILNDELLLESLGSNYSKYNYYSYNSKNYAIKIYDKDDVSYRFLEDYFSYTQEEKIDHTYYLLLNKDSVNLGKYGTSCLTSNALHTLTFLLGGN